MCQYSAEDGFFNDWHLVNAGQFATGGAGLVILEATAVESAGRISPQCAGLWSDAHVAPLARIVQFLHTQRAAAGLQLAHAGRKASTASPFAGIRRASVTAAEGGWPTQVVGASNLAWDKDWITPRELSVADIKLMVANWVAATHRANEAGVDFLEIHGAHGYLLSSFLSPLSNQRTDSYGGSFDNRVRLCLELTQAVRQAWPAHKPLAIRLTSTEWVPNGWNVDDTVQLARLLAPHVDLIDCSSGGNTASQQIVVGPGFQVPFAAAVKQAVGSQVLFFFFFFRRVLCCLL